MEEAVLEAVFRVGALFAWEICDSSDCFATGRLAGARPATPSLAVSCSIKSSGISLSSTVQGLKDCVKHYEYVVFNSSNAQSTTYCTFRFFKRYAVFKSSSTT